MKRDESNLFSDQPFLTIQSETFCRDFECFVSRHGGQVARQLPNLGFSPSPTLGELAMKVMTAHADTVVLQNSLTAQYLLSTSAYDFGVRKLAESMRDVITVAGSQTVAHELNQANIQPSKVNSCSSEWRRLLQLLDRAGGLSNQMIAIEKTLDLGSIRAGLEARGATVFSFSLFAQDIKPRVAVPEIADLGHQPKWRFATLIFELDELQSLISWINDQFDTFPSHVLVLTVNPKIEEYSESQGLSSRRLGIQSPLSDWSIVEAEEIARHLW